MVLSSGFIIGAMTRIILCLCLAIATGCASVSPPATIAVRLVAFNDFHGHIETAPRLATAVREMKSGHANTAVVAAGDLVGASPLASSLFLDEPAISALSDIGLELSSVGNHEFDRGRAHLERLQHGAHFTYLAANVIDRETGKPFMHPYVIRFFSGIPVAFVGAVLRGTPQVVSASGVRTLEFRDEAESVNALVPELRLKQVEAIVLLIHEGGRSTGRFDDPDCPGFSGAIIDIVKRLNRAVDVVVSGHTHEAYLCRVDGRLVTSAGSYGRYLTTIDLTIDRASRDVVASTATNVAVDNKFPANADLDDYVKMVTEMSRERSSRLIGLVEGTFSNTPDAAGESNLGNLVADSQLEAMRSAGAQVAFMNPGGLRAPLGSRGDGDVTYGDMYAVQPFGNTLVAMTLTGAQILRLLEGQWRVPPGARPRVLSVSRGFSYAYDGAKPFGERVVRGSVRLDGKPVEDGARYRIVVNSFLADGGDGFSVLTEGAERIGGPLDLDAFEAYVRDRKIVAAPPEGRITRR
jgi:5'-nucleotidase